MQSNVVTANWRDLNPDNFQFALNGSQISVTYTNEHGRAAILRMYTPPFITQFPRISVNAATDEEKKKASLSVDLTMKGARQAQRDFKAFMDELDDRLLDLVFKNQYIIGMNGKQTREVVAAAQKRCFRERISAKTGRQYEDAFTPRCKAFNQCGPQWVANTVAVLNADNDPITNEVIRNADPTKQYTSTLQGHSVSTCDRLDGAYANAAIGFGLSWTLLSVIDYGLALVGASDLEDGPGVFTFPEVSQEDMPSL